MHGIIFNQLYKFIREEHGPDTLTTVKDRAGVGYKFFDATKTHPDEDLTSIVTAASAVLNAPAEELLEAFGKFLVPGLLRTYSAHIKPEWNCMDLLEHVESTMHKVVRNANPDHSPPELGVKRVSVNEVQIEYTSRRKMSALGIGIIMGIAEHFGEQVNVKREPMEEGVLITVSQAG